MPNSKSRIHLARPHKTNNFNYKISKESTVQRVQRKQKKTKTKKLFNIKHSTISDEGCFNTNRFSLQEKQFEHNTDKVSYQLDNSV